MERYGEAGRVGFVLVRCVRVRLGRDWFGGSGWASLVQAGRGTARRLRRGVARRV